MSFSLRHLEQNLQQPTGFQQVMEVPGRPDLLMRVNGSVYAVFPRSEYSSGRSGPLPMIPANTVFYIGAPPASPAAPSLSIRAPAGARRSQANELGKSLLGFNQVSTQQDSEMHPRTAAPARSERLMNPFEGPSPEAAISRADHLVGHPVYDLAGATVTIATDDAYRLFRVQQLLKRAAKAESSKSPTSSDAPSQ